MKPLSKNGDKNKIKNYRHLYSTDIITTQYGFRKRKSTSVSIYITSSIRKK